MKYIRAKANFFRYADEKLVVTAGFIIRCMRQSTIFVDPWPPLSEVEDAYTDYYEKVIEATGGSRTVKAAKRQSKRKLSDLLQQLVSYVNHVSNGELLALRSSGFPVLEKKKKGQAPDTPGAPFLTDGRVSGEVAFGFKPVGRDMFYEYSFATAKDTDGMLLWHEYQTTTRSFKTYQSGFIPGQYVYFRVRARNKHGHSDWTEPIRLMVR